MAAICAAGVLAGTFAFAVNVNKEKAFKTEVTNALNIACGKSQPAKFMTQAGIDSTRAMAIVISNPKKLIELCEIVRQAMSNVLLDQPPPGKTKVAPPMSNNEELYGLADSLGITRALATEIVVKTHADSALEYYARLARMESRGEGLTQGHFAPFEAPAPVVVPEAPSPAP